MGDSILDCDEGRRLGCRTMCCRLVVRLAPGEPDPGGHRDPRKSCVDKDPRDGLCVYIDRRTGRCTKWHERPSVCRGYDCNHDPMLQVVIQDGVHSIVQAAQLVRKRRYPTKVTIPYVEPPDES